jgi:putative restriction endonuclease
MNSSESPNRNWSREEHILAFNLYCKIPFGTIHMRNPRIVELARLLGRTVGAVSYKLANFARLDPEQKARGIRGMTHGAKGEVEVWQEFYDDPERLAFESEQLLARLTGQSLEQLADIDEAELPMDGRERERWVRVRVNQAFFRKTILAAYDYRCCITGLALPELLVASHIIPWASSVENRMNPRNGLCLNALHDRAFERGLFVINKAFTIEFCPFLVSKPIDVDSGLAWLLSFEGKTIRFPQRFKPDPELLARHHTMSKLQVTWT